MDGRGKDPLPEKSCAPAVPPRDFRLCHHCPIARSPFTRGAKGRGLTRRGGLLGEFPEREKFPLSLISGSENLELDDPRRAIFSSFFHPAPFGAGLAKTEPTVSLFAIQGKPY